MLPPHLLIPLFLCFSVTDYAQSQRVQKLHVTSMIQTRFATTHVITEIQNTEEEDKEIFFEAQLPAEAFICNFTMLIKGKLEVGKVKAKKEARQDYDRARTGGQTAGLVEQKARETDRFRTSVNVAAGEKVTFDLTYQEVLKRVHGVYKHVINILSVQGVEDLLKIEVSISERGRIRSLHVPEFAPKVGQKTNKELLTLPVNTDATIRQNVVDGFAMAKITYHPPTKTAGQLAVLYDLERSYNGGDLEVVDGYFAHFFSPEKEGLTSAGTNVVFVLDKSGSMNGKKFEQLQEAMETILEDLKTNDRFSMVWFSSEVIAWSNGLRVANSGNVRRAQEFVQEQSSGGSTNMQDALLEAFKIIKLDKENDDNTAPHMIVSLTDGMPDQSSERIRSTIKAQNHDIDVRMHNLAFGDDADYKMLQQISSENNGLARKIYEASDASLQLEGFYSEIANILFTNIDMEYLDATVEESSIVKNRNDDSLYEGGEVVIAGKLKGITIGSIRGRVSTISSDGTEEEFRAGNECFACCTLNCPAWCSGWANCTSSETRPLRSRSQETLAPFGTLKGIVQRMWGYMTIKKLLKEADLESDAAVTQTKTDEALRLSLHVTKI